MAQPINFILTLDQTAEVLALLHNEVEIALEEIGLQATANAVKEITAAVYNQPPAPTYKRTGLLRNSIAYAVSGKQFSTGDYGGGKKARTYRSNDGTSKGTYTEKAPKANNDSELAVYIGTNVEYAPYVELGSSRSKRGPRPFIKPAIANYVDQYKTIIQRNLGG